uniref:Uncharacterized protein n=1 Tax=Arundo donax TaxID=35708 RepID=A0A0A8Y2H6_ARUDO
MAFQILGVYVTSNKFINSTVNFFFTNAAPNVCLVCNNYLSTERTDRVCRGFDTVAHICGFD